MPAFSPQALTRADIDAYRQRALEEARKRWECWQSGLEQAAGGGPGDGRRRAGAGATRVPARIEALSSQAPQGLKMRIHGDYHLGQVLVTRNDFVIIDFEGEPGNSLEQRRAKHSPLRDVAGMLRSFSYVQHSALRNVAHNEAEAARLAPLAQAWESEVRDAFLVGLRCGGARSEALWARGAAVGRVEAGSGLLGLFELEKALYELRYELGNRPAWAGIPLQGILDWVPLIMNDTLTAIERVSGSWEAGMQSIDILLETAREFLHQGRHLPAAAAAGAGRGGDRMAARQGGAFRRRERPARDQFAGADRTRRHR